MVPISAVAEYESAKNQTQYTFQTASTQVIASIGDFSGAVQDTGMTKDGDATTGALGWGVLANQAGKTNSWSASFGPTSTPMTVGKYSLIISSHTSPSTQYPSDATHMFSDLHGTLDATLEPTSPTGATGELTLHGTF
jgi:hypothetical protein